MKYLRYLMFYTILVLPMAVQALTYEKGLEDPELEQKAQELFKEIRCLVCISQPISESDTELARDLRGLIRQELKNDKNPQKIKDFLVSRYGSQILLSPPVDKSTYMLWLAPLIFLIIGVMILISARSRKQQ